MDRLSELLGRHVRFAYTALDRIVLNGYLDRLQRPEDLVHFFHQVAGAPCIDPGALAERTERYRAWVDRYAAERGIPVLRAPKGARKEDLVRPYYRRLSGAEGVACILSSMDQNRTLYNAANC